MDVASHRDLHVWQKPMDLAVACYRLTQHVPKSALYNLTSQLQRAAVPVAANIAEGKGRRMTGAYLSIAAGSLAE